MRDILPEQMLKRQYVLDVVRTVFEEYGFEPLQTPAVELSETLLGKYGPEAERLIYKTWYGDEPGGEFALRYDLTVPLSRVVAMYPDLPRPFKRYQIAPVYRADRPQKGRYREFYQCDVDIVGTSSMMADAEIVAVVVEVLTRLGFSGVSVSINNRKLLYGIGEYAGVPDSLRPGLYRSIDKLDKIGLDGVRRELLMVGVPTDLEQPLQRVSRLVIQGKVGLDDVHTTMIDTENLDTDLTTSVVPILIKQLQLALDEGVAGNLLQARTREIVQELAPALRDYYSQQSALIPTDAVDHLLDLLQLSGDKYEVLDRLENEMSVLPRAVEGIRELRELFSYLAAMGIDDAATRLNFAMVRGLEYYTGPIFETTVEEPATMPSITGGGRYDELIGLFSDTAYPVTGTSLGIERIIDAMDELGMFPESIRSSTAQVLVALFDTDTQAASIEMATELRRAGINTSIYYDYTDRLGDQIGYASAKGIPFVVIIGPDELARGEATIREMGETRREGDQRTVPLSEVVKTIQSW
jgi:histidyl-tRNA synthetase